jgi:hypothetical protein
VNVEVRFEEGEYVAVDDEVLSVGFGATEAEARAALNEDIESNYAAFRNMAVDGRLGDKLAAVLAIMAQRREKA